MTCPHPLDPLCVAILLRLSESSIDVEGIAADLGVTPETVNTRMHRLTVLGTVSHAPQSNKYSLQPSAYQVILSVAEKPDALMGSRGASGVEDRCRARLARLQGDPMFRDLPYDELVRLARASRSQSLAPGEMLLLEGDECQGLYIVDRGTIRLSKGSSSSSFGFGREQTIALMTVGDSFNEVPVFDGGPNPVTAEAIEESCVIMIPRAEVQTLIERSPEFAAVIISLMSKRLRHMLAMVEDVAMRDVTGRVAKILLQLQTPSDGVGSGVRVGRRLTQREIAEMAGTAREVVARVLKKMERTGAIAVRRGDVQILDAELLESFT